MFNFKKMMLSSIVFSFFGYSMAASADNFDYATEGQCRAKMYEYNEKTNKRANEFQSGSPEWRGFRSMAVLTDLMNTGSWYEISCENNQCTHRWSTSCGALSLPTWKSLIVPRLQRDLGPYVPNFERYNPNLERLRYIVQCPGTWEQPDWNRCELKV